MEAITSVPGMNALFIVVVVLLAIGFVRGVTQGFLKLIFSLVAGIAVIVVVAIATPHVATFVVEHTTIENEMSENISTLLEGRVEKLLADGGSGSKTEQGMDQSANLSALGIVLPALFEKNVTAGQNYSGNQLLADVVESAGVYDAIGDRLAMLVIKGICYVLVLILALFIVGCIGKALKRVNDVPVIGPVNRVAGIFVGVFESLLAIWVFFAIIAFMSAGGTGAELVAMIKANILLEMLYDNNLVVALLAYI